MKVSLIIGIMIVGVIGIIAVFASMPSETWQDNRTDLTGVPLPDENKEKIDCLSRGGSWDNGCSIERRNVSSENEIGVTCLGKEECLALNVSQIIDGDTIYADSYKIRLSLVDTPEKGESGHMQATAFTSMSCPVGSRIIVDQDDGQPYDEYDRMLGKVYCETGILNEILLRNGHAEILTQYCSTSEFAGEAWAKKFGCVMKHQETTPLLTQESPKSTTTSKEDSCDALYPDVCIPSPPPDLDCGEISYRNFTVLPPDPHRFDGDKDGIGCEK
jgi:micrococcal nuclease